MTVTELKDLIYALTPIVLPVIMWQLNRINKKVDSVTTETRENLGHLAKSINGSTHEAMAKAVDVAMHAGARLGAASTDSPEANQRLEDGLTQVSQQAMDAAQSAKVASAEATAAILEVPKK